MGQIKPVPHVKLFVGMLSSSLRLLEETVPVLESEFGPCDFRSEPWPFGFTEYYTKEMGTPLWRRFVAFERLIPPEAIREAKIRTNELESSFSAKFSPPPRPINLDPGYVSLAKVVLATTKDYTHRICLGGGIFAEVTLFYRSGRFEPFDWTYPDYRTPEYLDFFRKLRESCRVRSDSRQSLGESRNPKF